MLEIVYLLLFIRTTIYMFDIKLLLIKFLYCMLTHILLLFFNYYGTKKICYIIFFLLANIYLSH